MTLRTDIQAVRDNGALTDAERRSAIYELKASAIEALFAPRVGQTISRGIYTVTLLKPVVVHPNRTVEFWIAATKNGLPVALDLPILIVNPPIMVPDGVGGFTENLLQAIRDVLMDLIR